jgi:hypothetical protein
MIRGVKRQVFGTAVFGARYEHIAAISAVAAPSSTARVLQAAKTETK